MVRSSHGCSAATIATQSRACNSSYDERTPIQVTARLATWRAQKDHLDRPCTSILALGPATMTAGTLVACAPRQKELVMRPTLLAGLMVAVTMFGCGSDDAVSDEANIVNS